MNLVSWDGNNINDGTNYDAVLNANFQGLPGVKAIMGKRHGNWPILGGIERPGRDLNFDIYIRSGSSLELAQWFDPEDETVKQLIVNTPGEESPPARYVNGICTEFREVPFSAGLQYAVTIQVDGDVRWRETAITSPSAWSVTATGQTNEFTNSGQDKVYPIIKIKPTSGKTGAYLYKRFIVIRWRADTVATNYPVDIVNNAFDTATLTPAKMQADGDDLRVWVDGIEADRWLQDMDDATTQVWINLDFEADVAMTLDGAINDSVTSFQVNEDITNMPSTGIVYIDTEAITYNSKSNSTKTFSGCTRGAKTTSAAAQADNADVDWLQHDIWILYGNSAVSAPSVDDDYKPMFELASTNVSWDYNDFREQHDLYPTLWKPRAGAWLQSGNVEDFYTSTQGASVDPAAEIGMYSDSIGEQGWMYVGNACGITSANFQNGEHKATVKTDFGGKLRSGLTTGLPTVDEYTIPDPANDNTWDTWSRNETLDANSKSVGMYLLNGDFDEMWVESADVTLALNSSYTPLSTIGSEVTNYDLDATITNNTTGDAIQVTYSMQLNEELEVDTDDKTIILLDDNSNQFQALAILGTLRKDWLALDVGSNTLQFDDTGTGNVTITVTWWERYYE